MPPDIVRNAHFKRFVCIKVSEFALAAADPDRVNSGGVLFQLSPNLISFLDIADRNVPINAATANSVSGDKSETAKSSFWDAILWNL